MSPIEELIDVMRQLRDPKSGCAWDLKQTFASIAPYTIEEAYEVADAIERNDMPDLKDELGDLLLQVVFHAQMATEAGNFNFDDVANSIVEKLVRRHPHIFGDDELMTAEDVKANWDKIKAAERAAKPKREDTSALAGVAKALPALMRAEKIQQRAADVGFDWAEPEPVWEKLQEEIGELNSVANSDAINDKQSAIEDELGDVLFTVVNLARHYKVDSEVAMKNATAKFEQRFREVEILAERRNIDMSDSPLSLLDALWDEVKAQGANR